jgi:hypothetical protein
VPKRVRNLLIGLAAAVLAVAIYCIGYLALAAIAPGRAPITNQGITEAAGIATAAPAAALALLTIALVLANFDLAQSSQSLATLTAEQITAQWEPFVNARLDQIPGAWPRQVSLTNFTTGPAIDCVYVSVFEDPRGLGMWQVTNPIDLQGFGQPQSLLARAHGFDRMEFDVTDAGEVGMRRVIRRTIRAFQGDDHVNRAVEGSRHVTHVGLPPPPGELFTHQDGTHQVVAGRQEAVLCMCANGHVHRTLPHLRKPAERFQPDDPKVAWLTWYLKEARYGIPAPEAANLMQPEREPWVVERQRL